MAVGTMGEGPFSDPGGGGGLAVDGPAV
eukprot:COSAG02_NODE_3969_length_5974_cov_1.685957_1_plen_27_part_10